MSRPTDAWRAEHESFARLLDLFGRELDRFHAGENPDYELMIDVLTYLRHFPERSHHPREDVAFARLVQHDRSLEPVVSRFLQEHRVIGEALREAQSLLAAVAGDEFVARERVEAACATLLVYYRHHLAGENSLILPVAARLLTRADWEAVGRAVAADTDPLFGGEVDTRYRELRERIEAAARR